MQDLLLFNYLYKAKSHVKHYSLLEPLQVKLKFN